MAATTADAVHMLDTTCETVIHLLVSDLGASAPWEKKHCHKRVGAIIGQRVCDCSKCAWTPSVCEYESIRDLFHRGSARKHGDILKVGDNTSTVEIV